MATTDDDKAWWKKSENMKPGGLGMAIGLALGAVGMHLYKKKDEDK